MADRTELTSERNEGEEEIGKARGGVEIDAEEMEATRGTTGTSDVAGEGSEEDEVRDVHGIGGFISWLA